MKHSKDYAYPAFNTKIPIQNDIFGSSHDSFGFFEMFFDSPSKNISTGEVFNETKLLVMKNGNIRHKNIDCVFPFREEWAFINGISFPITQKEYKKIFSENDLYPYVLDIINKHVMSNNIFQSNKPVKCPFCNHQLSVFKNNDKAIYCFNVSCGGKFLSHALFHKFRIFTPLSEETLNTMYYLYFINRYDYSPSYMNSIVENFKKVGGNSGIDIFNSYINMSVKNFLEICGIPSDINTFYAIELEELNHVRLLECVSSQGDLFTDNVLIGLGTNINREALQTYIDQLSFINRNFLKNYYLTCNTYI